MRRKRKVYALFGAEPKFQSPRQVSPSFQVPGKEVPRASLEPLGGTVGKWGLQGNDTKTLQGGLGMEARNGGWGLVCLGRKNHNYPWEAPGLLGTPSGNRDGWSWDIQC